MNKRTLDDWFAMIVSVKNSGTDTVLEFELRQEANSDWESYSKTAAATQLTISEATDKYIYIFKMEGILNSVELQSHTGTFSIDLDHASCIS
jgi:hypothetical protein